MQSMATDVKMPQYLVGRIGLRRNRKTLLERVSRVSTRKYGTEELEHIHPTTYMSPVGKKS